jgi:16S rRNA U516 pseudouridylate synthase RsuA-like enzyme
MFHAIGNKVVGLHRAQIGELKLGQLPVGSYTLINQNLEPL